MTFIFAISCFLTAFTPASAIFYQIVAKDPLRVILFFLGAFFWLVSLLASSLVWLIIPKAFLTTLIISAFFQEIARSIYYFLLHKAQGGLAKLATNNANVTGLRFLHPTRHVLAVVCGLGMGVMVALNLCLNLIADSSRDGVVGLPASISEISKSMEIQLNFKDALYPIFYCLSCSFLILNHVCWTIILWDGLHKWINKLTLLWWPPILYVIIAHLFNSFISYFLSTSSFFLLIGLHGVLLAVNSITCIAIVKNYAFFSTITTTRETSSL